MKNKVTCSKVIKNFTNCINLAIIYLLGIFIELEFYLFGGKQMNKLMIATLLTVFSSAVLADNVIITQTQSWKSVPITVDAKKHTYIVEGTMPEGD